MRFKFGFPFGKHASEFRFPWLFLGFRPEDPSLRLSIYLTIPGFPVGSPALNLGFRHQFWVSWTARNPVISSPAGSCINWHCRIIVQIAKYFAVLRFLHFMLHCMIFYISALDYKDCPSKKMDTFQ